jgi:DNA invertase Pin-like site-specific DNA recombinase
MHIRSIYEEHYLGETYRTGVAYLRARKEGDDRAPRMVGDYSLARQRELIAKAARAQGVIISAEYIEYADYPGDRPAFTSMVTFMSETGVPDLFVAREEYLARRQSDFGLFMTLLRDSQITLNPATDRWRQH